MKLPPWPSPQPLPCLPAKPDLCGPTPTDDSGLVPNSELKYRPILTDTDLSRPILTDPAPVALPADLQKYFYPGQIKWLADKNPLRIIEKSRQVGMTYVDAYDSVKKASVAGAKFDVWVSSSNETQARLYLEDCKYWAKYFHLKARDYGEVVFDKKNKFSAYVLQFANGRRIYCLSSNPDALAGKRGHVKLDEFALHEDQRRLFTVAKPVTMWGGQLSIISTHRGRGTLFNQIIEDVRNGRNRMGWSLHSLPLHQAVEEGLVERINERAERNETREGFIKRLHDECIDEDQWNQEYCCKPADANAAFFPHEMITACEDSSITLLTFEQLLELIAANPHSVFYIGMDVARKVDLCVIDLGEKIGDVMWDRLRIELHKATFPAIEFELYRLLRLPQVKRCCIDATRHDQLAERARDLFGWKVEGHTFTAPFKEELAFGLRRDFEDRKLRLVRDDDLRSDLRALKKEVTSSGNIRLDGQSGDSHCDRTWAKALRQHAARYRPSCGGAVA